ncbi:MAG: hypothetical protein EOO11_16215 [Chitinophagaceae bacterium]|nr:MAG: hypothetical protein EOO11_16215 [Chitinophagaceae bacterium]
MNPLPLHSPTNGAGDLLQVIRAIGSPTGSPLAARRLDGLHAYLAGYCRYPEEAGLPLAGADLLHHFSIYLKRELDLHHYEPLGWYGYLSARYGAGEAGFDAFFGHFGRFLATRTPVEKA